MKFALCQRSLTVWRAPGQVQWLLLIAIILSYQTASAAQDSWPREIQTKEESITIYQPQLESFQGDQVTDRAAVMVQKTATKTPVFGVVWFDSRIVTDRDPQRVEFQDIKVAKIKLPNTPPEQERRFAALLEQEMAAGPKITINRDQLLADWAEVEKIRAGAYFNNTPPKILFMTAPSVLVLIDGPPILRDVAGFPVKRVVNTPFVLLFDPANPQYYLTGDALWFVASDLKGPWQTLESPPGPVVATAQRIAEAEVPTQVQTADLKTEVIPQIVVATEPTELIVADGAPQFAPLEGVDLLYLTNTGRDVFQVISSQQFYVLLSGRWFTSPSLEQGPWSYVAPDQLPASFYQIPPASVKGHVLAFVPETPQAQEAVAEAQIPITAAISRTTTLPISYEGEPQFQPIDGTSLQCAVNTNQPVIKARNQYYAVDRAVWYSSDRPAGRYRVATWVPPEIYQIPPSSPWYYVTYVRVYHVTPRVVYFGYTPGYLGTYVVGRTIVYGTGYVYPPYVAPTVYYPAPVTYGYAPIYDPGYGAWNFLAGATFGFIAGAATSNRWGGCCGWYGNVAIDINSNVTRSRDYVQHLNVERAKLRNAHFNRQNVQNLGAHRQDFRNNLYKNPKKLAKQIENTRHDQLHRHSERFTDRQGGRADHVQDQRAHKGERRSRPAAQSRQEASTSARSEPRRSARQAPSLQGRQASHEGMRKGARQGAREPHSVSTREARPQPRQGAREPHSVSTREARPQPRAKPAESGHHSPRAQGTERTKNVQRSGGGGFSRGGGSHGGGRH